MIRAGIATSARPRVRLLCSAFRGPAQKKQLLLRSFKIALIAPNIEHQHEHAIKCVLNGYGEDANAKVVRIIVHHYCSVEKTTRQYAVRKDKRDKDKQVTKEKSG